MAVNEERGDQGRSKGAYPPDAPGGKKASGEKKHIGTQKYFASLTDKDIKVRRTRVAAECNANPLDDYNDTGDGEDSGPNQDHGDPGAGGDDN
jgi:hypothetical protein